MPSAPASTGPENRMRKPPLSISIVPTAGAAAKPVVTLAALPSSGKPADSVDFSWMRTGTNASPPALAPRSAARRQVCRQTAINTVKRAKSERFTPGCRTLGNHRRLLRGGPSSASRSTRDQFDPAILAAFVPVLMYGAITGTSHSDHPTARLKLAACRTACPRRQVTASHRTPSNAITRWFFATRSSTPLTS